MVLLGAPSNDFDTIAIFYCLLSLSQQNTDHRMLWYNHLSTWDFIPGAGTMYKMDI